jgi:hypothetical protein
MRKILNFIVLLILIKRNNIFIFKKNFERSSDYYYYFDESNKTTTLFKKKIYASYINYEVCYLVNFNFKTKINYPFELWNWQAKFLYKMAKNKYLKS